MKTAYVIINPKAGTKQSGKVFLDIISILRGGGYESIVAPTTKAGDGFKLAQEACKKYDMLIAIGGDGTFNEVASGVAHSSGTVPIGYIPAGSTNDFAETIGMSTDMTKAAKEITKGKPVPIDMGDFNGRYFSYIASFGAFTGASYSTPQEMKNVFGHFAYILQGVKELSNIQPYKVSLIADGREDSVYEGDYIFGAVCNTTSVAGILTLDENVVDMSDGEFEVILIKAPANIIELNQIIFSLTRQNYKGNGLIEFFSAKELKIEAESKMDWTLDGEYQEGNGDIVINNVHKAINLVVPRGHGDE